MPMYTSFNVYCDYNPLTGEWNITSIRPGKGIAQENRYCIKLFTLDEIEAYQEATRILEQHNAR